MSFHGHLPPTDVFLKDPSTGAWARIPDPPLSPGLARGSSSSENYFLDADDNGVFFRDPNIFESREVAMNTRILFLFALPFVLIALVCALVARHNKKLDELAEM